MEEKGDKSRLQHDDPSIIHCTSGVVVSKQQQAYRPNSSSRRSHESLPKEKMKPTTSRPKTVPASKNSSGNRRAIHSHVSSPKHANSMYPNFHHQQQPSSQSKPQGAKGMLPPNKNSSAKNHDKLDKKRSLADSATNFKAGSPTGKSVHEVAATNFKSFKHQGFKSNRQSASQQKLLPHDQVGDKASFKKQNQHQDKISKEPVHQKHVDKVSRSRKGNADSQTKDSSAPSTRLDKGQVHPNNSRSQRKTKVAHTSTAPSKPITDDKLSERNIQRKSIKKQSTIPTAAPSAESIATSKPTHPENKVIGQQILDIVNGKSKASVNAGEYQAKPSDPSPVVQDMEEKQKLIDEILSSKIPSSKPKDGEEPKKENEQAAEQTMATMQPLPSNDTKESERLVKLGLEQAAERLKKDFIVLMKKKSDHFPNAKFYCKACNYHLDSVPLAHRHIKDKRHRKAMKERQQNEQMRNLTKPPLTAVKAIDELLQKNVLQGLILEEEDLKRRKRVVEKLNQIIKEQLPHCSVKIYGSSCSGFGFKTSDINVDLQHSDDVKPPAALLSVLDLLVHCDAYSKVQPDLCAKVPKINFVDDESSLCMELSTGNEFASYTTRLLRVYALLDPRVVQLSMVLRTWAQMCKLDRQQEGSLPRHAYVLMTIFFMQVHDYLPVLHEMISEWDMAEILNSSGACGRLDKKGKDLWYYPSVCDGKGKKNNIKADEDTDSESELDVSIMSFQDETIDLTLLSSPDNDAPINEKSAGSFPRLRAADKPIALCEKCLLGDKTPGELWLELLKFYAIEYPIEEQIIDVRSSTWLSREDKNWGKKRIAIIDPYTSKRNLCRSLNTQGIFTYFMARLRAAVVYFYNSSKRANKEANNKTVKSSTSPVKKDSDFDKDLCTTAQDSTSEVATDSSSKSPTTVTSGSTKPNSTDQFADRLSEAVLEKVLHHFVDAAEETGNQSSGKDAYSNLHQMADRVVEEVIRDLLKTNISPRQDSVSSTADRLASEITGEAIKEISSRLSKTHVSSSTQEETSSPSGKSAPDQEVAPSSPDSGEQIFVYQFNVSVITNGIFPVKVCSLCKREGHARPNCPDEVKAHKITPLEPLSQPLHNALDRICVEIYEHFAPNKHEIRDRDDICNSLMLYLQQTYNSDTMMTLFGSSRNGFGFKDSDLDICMTFKGDSMGEGLDFVRIIEDVAKYLRWNPSLRHILPITTAKVPIVKFQHKHSPLEGDISLYNLLAQRNSSMLLCYSMIDSRCKLLGYVIKYFVKLCSIGDASRGSLSSYAYTLMVIFYLQRKKTPVLPVLQELYEGKERPVVTIDGWNSWFFNDIKNLDKVWDGWGKNKETIGELWLGLLRFYIEEWDFKRHVICIRQKKLLTSFEKEWTSKCISIEDPFDLNHNLAAGVSLKMTNFIIRVFVKAREHFGTWPMFNIKNEVLYFFDPDILMDGEDAPNDRCCKLCGKIGHYVRDCPKNKRRKGKDSNNEPNDHRCFGCGEIGHIRRDCPEAKKADNQSQPAKSQNLKNSPRKRKADNDTNVTKPQSNPPVERTKPPEQAKQSNTTTPMTQETTSGKGQNRSQPTPSSDSSKSTSEECSVGSANRSKLLGPTSSSSSCTPTKSDAQKNSSDKTTPVPSFGIFNDLQVLSAESENDHSPTPRSAGFSEGCPIPPGFFNFSRNQRNPDPAHSQISYLSRSAPPSNQRLMAYPQMPHSPHLTHSPQKAMTVGQLESKMLGETPQPLPSPKGNLSAAELKSQQDFQYLAQRNLYGSLPSPVSPISMVPAAPILGMGVTLPQPQFQGFPTPPGIQRTEVQFPGRNFPERSLTSPLRHQPPNTSFGSPAFSWNPFPQGDPSSPH